MYIIPRLMIKIGKPCIIDTGKRNNEDKNADIVKGTQEAYMLNQTLRQFLGITQGRVSLRSSTLGRPTH